MVIEDYFATGEEVIRTLVEETPPGFTNRVMGLQNIKGTGLDFVYRFQAWDVCHDACALVHSKQANEIEKGLQSLIAMPVVGQLCYELVAETVNWCRSSKELATFSDLVEQLAAKIELSPHARSEAEIPSSADPKNSWAINADFHHWVYSTAEQIFDVNDSVRRRDKADDIYHDLGALRISRQRAIIELRNLTKRQKGGWLSTKKSA